MEELSSNEMEFLTEAVSQIVEERFGESGIIPDEDSDNGTKYTEEAQDFFNERYNELETLYLTLVKNSHWD